MTDITTGVQHGETCGCCVGLQTRTPAEVRNAPGLSAVAYRIGTWSSLRETLLSHFATTPTKSGDVLDPRSGENFAAALADAWAVVGDILTFYQERIANESYLRTATERLSVLELARMIGYELKPGVAAEAWLAFTVDDPPAPQPAVAKKGVASFPLPVRRDAAIARGLKVQSVPGPDEKPQTFETVEEITGWPEWNAIPLRVRQPQAFTRFSIVLYVPGQVDLRVGEYMLVLHNLNAAPAQHQPHVRQVRSIQWDEATGMTQIVFEWADPTGIIVGPPTPYEDLSQSKLIREKLPLSSAMVKDEIIIKNVTVARAWHAEDLATAAAFQGWDLDQLESAIYHYAQRSRVKEWGVGAYRFGTRAAIFGHNGVDPNTLPADVTKPDDPSTRDLKQESDAMNWGNAIDLDSVYPQVAKSSWVVLSAYPSKISQGTLVLNAYRVVDRLDVSRSAFLIHARATRLQLSAGTQFNEMTVRRTSVSAQNIQLPVGTEPVDPMVKDYPTNAPRKGLVLDGVFLRLRSGQAVVVTGIRADLEGQQGSEVRVLEAVRIENGLTTIFFDTPLEHDYVWTTVTVNANVAHATHGESTAETLGSGDAAQPYQSFALRQKPLTYTSSATSPTGSESSLKVFVNDVRWHEAPFLYGHESTERIYSARRQDDGTTAVQFGDGLTGARLSTGAENIRAEYRKGIGLEGLVRADQLTLLLSRPLNVKGVTNPLAAAGAADPEPRDEARRNAPLQVLTLDRAVSLRDYEDFARAFAGVAKSLATRISGREKPGVFVTVAGPNGAAFVKTDTLAVALRTFGDPFVPIVVKSFHQVLFRIEATVRIDPDHVPGVVRKAIEDALRRRYSFDAQSFGQPVFHSEAVAIVQGIDGVVSVALKLIDALSNKVDAIPAVVPFGDVTDATLGADLLLLDPRPVTLTVTT